MKRLIAIQNELIAPKDKKNKESNRSFTYRTAEAILARVKPLCASNGLAIVLSDEAINVGDRYFIKSIARLITDEGVELINATACAELDPHTFVKNGISTQMMSMEQATGSASSYARKYALCALFAIDDEQQDPDNGYNDIKAALENAPTKDVLREIWENRGKTHPSANEFSAIVTKRLKELAKQEQPEEQAPAQDPQAPQVPLPTKIPSTSIKPQ